MPDFINTIDLLGDDAVMDSIIDRTITEFKDDHIAKINGSGAFKGCSQLKTVWLPNADFDGTTQIGYQFDSCTSLVDVQIPSAKMLGRGQFNNCTSLVRLVLPSVVKLNMQTFTKCSNLTTLDFHKTVDHFSTGHITQCSKLKGIIFRGDGVVSCGANPNWIGTLYQNGTGYIYVPGSLVSSYKSAENWSTIAEQFRGIIDDKEALQGIIDETLVDFENNEIVEIPERAFYKYAPLKSVKSDSVTEIGMNAFRLSGATEVDFPELVTSGTAAFYDCKSLTQANFPKLTTVATMMFSGCDKLTEVNIPNATAIESGAFQSCTALMKLDCPKVTAINGTNVFGFFNSNCMNTLILRSETMCTLANTGSFGTGATAQTAIGKGNGYIYVPRALVDSYKVAENWSTYATQFRALEDYTVDGTTTGELDESKI